MLDRAHHVLHINPAHPLPPVSASPAQSQLERQQHRAERSALRAEHDPGPQLCRANAGLHGGHGRFLPLPANLRQKSRARRASLSQHFIAAVAVVPDRGSANENLRFLLRLRQSPRQIPCPSHAAVSNLRFLLLGPSSEDGFTRKMNHGVKSRHRLGCNRYRRIPRNLPRTPSRTPHQPHRGPSTRSERRKKRCPNRPRHPANQNSRVHDVPVVTISVDRAQEQTADGFEIFEAHEMPVYRRSLRIRSASRRPWSRDDLQGFRVGSINDQVGVDREEFNCLIRQVFAPVSGAGASRQENNFIPNDRLNAVRSFDAASILNVAPDPDKIERGFRRKDVAPCHLAWLSVSPDKRRVDPRELPRPGRVDRCRAESSC